MMPETRDLIITLAEIGNGVGASLADDGKITWTDFPKFMTALTTVPALISGITKIDDELKAATEDDVKNLITDFMAKFDLPQDEAEAKVEACIDAAYALVKAIKSFF